MFDLAPALLSLDVSVDFVKGPVITSMSNSNVKEKAEDSVNLPI
jgi:hypothetical protein